MFIAAKKVQDRGATDKSSQKYAAELMDDLSKHVPKVQKITKIFQKMLVEPPVDGELPQLMKLMADCKSKHHTIMLWASRFALIEPPQKKRRRS
jgi:hypothetical protein